MGIMSLIRECKNSLEGFEWSKEIIKAQVPAVAAALLGGLGKLAGPSYVFGLAYQVSKVAAEKILSDHFNKESISVEEKEAKIKQYSLITAATVGSFSALICGASLVSVVTFSVLFVLFEKWPLLALTIPNNDPEKPSFSFGNVKNAMKVIVFR